MRKALALGFLAVSAFSTITLGGSSACQVCSGSQPAPQPSQKPGIACQPGQPQPQKPKTDGDKKEEKKGLAKDQKKVWGIHGEGCTCGRNPPSQ
jgi:hypothetical protein